MGSKYASDVYVPCNFYREAPTYCGTMFLNIFKTLDSKFFKRLLIDDEFSVLYNQWNPEIQAYCSQFSMHPFIYELINIFFCFYRHCWICFGHLYFSSGDRFPFICDWTPEKKLLWKKANLNISQTSKRPYIEAMLKDIQESKTEHKTIKLFETKLMNWTIFIYTFHI